MRERMNSRDGGFEGAVQYEHTISKIMIVGMKKSAGARVVRLGMKLKPAHEGDGIAFLELVGIKPQEAARGLDSSLETSG